VDEPYPREVAPPIHPMACLRCGARLEDAGWQHLRNGGLDGLSPALGIPGAGERFLVLRMFACAACGNVEFRMPPPGAIGQRPDGTLW
jgi:hypothetical protein